MSRRNSFVVIVVGVLIAVGFTAGWLVGRSNRSADVPTDAMVAAVDSWTEAVVGQDAAGIAALYAEDARWYDEALDDTFTGRSGVRSAWGIFAGIDEVTVDELAVNSDTAVLRWTFVRAPRLDLTGISVLDFEGDVIVAETVYYDCAQSPVSSICANVR